MQNLYDGVRNSTREVSKDQIFISEVRNLIIEAKREVHRPGIERMTKIKMSSDTHMEMFGLQPAIQCQSYREYLK